MPLITPAELATKLQRTIADDVAQQACDLASAQVQALTKQTLVQASHVEHVELDVLVVDGVMRAVTPLWQRPVVAVDTVTVAGVDLYEDAWWWEPSLDLVVLADATTARATIEYTAGYDPIPGDLKAVALMFAAAEVANPTGVVSESLGDYSVTWSDKATTARIDMILGSYRRRAGTIRLG